MEEAEEQRAYVRRHKTLQDHITTIGGIVAITGAVVAGIGWTLGIMPFVRTDVYQNDMSKLASEISALQAFSKDYAEQLVDIKRTGLLTLQLNLKSRLEILNAAIDSVSRGSPTYLGLVGERDKTQQQLDEINRELAR